MFFLNIRVPDLHCKLGRNLLYAKALKKLLVNVSEVYCPDMFQDFLNFVPNTGCLMSNCFFVYGSHTIKQKKTIIRESCIQEGLSKLKWILVQVNLFQKHLFLQQLTHNMKKECSLIYQFLHENYKLRTCCVHKLFFVFVLAFKTIYVHNMF